MKRANSSKAGVTGARVDFQNYNNQGSEKLMKKVYLGFLVFTLLALFLTTGCLGKGKRQVLENPQDLMALNESAAENGVAALEEESSSLYEDPFFEQGSGSGSTNSSGSGSTGSAGSGSSGSGGAGTAGSGSSGGSGGASAGGANGGSSGGAGAPGDLPPHTDEDPPAGDPPAGDPPAGDPPAGDPPAGDPPAVDPPADDDDLLERTRDQIREQAQFSNNPYFRLDYDLGDLLPGDDSEPAPDDSSYDRVFLDIGDMLPQP